MVTRRKFNITGSCNPERNYMVDSKKRFVAVENLIDAGEYSILITGQGGFINSMSATYTVTPKNITDTNKVTMFFRDGRVERGEVKSKKSVAEDIVSMVEEMVK